MFSDDSVNPFTHTPYNVLLAVTAPINKRAIRVLTPTTPILGTLNTPRSITTSFALDTRRVPEERPRARFRPHLRPRSAVVRLTGSVGSAVVAVVLVVLGEDGEGLLRGTRVVAAFGGLDGFARFDG
jgi:hypothetical protein